MNGFYAYLQSLDPRERKMLLILIAFLSVVFSWLCVWQPSQRLKENNFSHYQEAVSDFKWIQAHAQDIKSVQPGTATAHQPLPGGSLLTAITQTAKDYNMTIDRAEPGQDNTIAISLENAAFQNLIPYLASLGNAYAIDVKTITISRLPQKPGYVSSNMVLQLKQ